MAEYQVQAPDGKVLTIEGPDNATDEQLQTQASQLYSQHLEESKKSKSEETGPVNPESSFQTFASKAVNAMGFGLPEYLDKKFGNPTSQGWQSPEQRQQIHQEAAAVNPNAARYGEITGDVAGLAIPVGYGAKTGKYLAKEGMTRAMANKSFDESLKAGAMIGDDMLKYAGSLRSEAAAARQAGDMKKYIDLTEQVNKITQPIMTGAKRGSELISQGVQRTGQVIGGVMGGQIGAAIPEVLQGRPEMGVAKSAELGKLPGKLPFGIGSAWESTGLGNVVPVGLSALDMVYQYNKDKNK